MNKDDFIKKIKEAESNLYKNNPCYHCVGNGCDDCRGCEDAIVSHQMKVEIRRLKNEYRTKFGVDYDEDLKAIADAMKYMLIVLCARFFISVLTRRKCHHF